ncbi:hypothetical protein AC578_1657 [Pseudocercospora eumusae]|uniref:Myb-like domain-containing protein n=1 Tax=Pseudocercospora eumusae TaxID=321146 RepID=A0A139HM56_9PEZI|nr:hypothetical protein AC578_1657 [Pseudocercospora eumusae]
MPIPWTDSNQKRLLLTILHLTAPSPPKWEEVANHLGEGCSAEAARQQFKNLKKKAKEEFGEMPASGGRGGKKKAGGGVAGSKRKGSTIRTEEEESPVKKVKTGAEDEAEDDDGLGA